MKAYSRNHIATRINVRKSESSSSSSLYIAALISMQSAYNWSWNEQDLQIFEVEIL